DRERRELRGARNVARQPGLGLARRLRGLAVLGKQSRRADRAYANHDRDGRQDRKPASAKEQTDLHRAHVHMGSCTPVTSREKLPGPLGLNFPPDRATSAISAHRSSASVRDGSAPARKREALSRVPVGGPDDAGAYAWRAQCRQWRL